MLVFFATLILLVTLLYLWKTRLDSASSAIRFINRSGTFFQYKSSRERCPQPSCSRAAQRWGWGFSEGARQPRSPNWAKANKLLAPSWACWAETHCYVHLAVVGPGC